MSQTLRAVHRLTSEWDYEEVVTIGNPVFSNQFASAHTYANTLATGYAADLVYVTTISIAAGSTTIDLNSFADRLGNTKDFAKLKSITAMCTSGTGRLQIEWNASGVAPNLDSTSSAKINHPMESGSVFHVEKPTATGIPVVAGDTISAVRDSGTFTVKIVLVGSA